MLFTRILTLCIFSSLFIQKSFSLGVYGPDDRLETSDAPRSIQELGGSVAAMMSKETLKSFAKGVNIAQDFSLEKKMNICFDQKFAGQPSLADCSGFLIAPNLILTAGHCIKLNFLPCENYSWVFDYYLDNGYDLFSGAEVVECKSIKKVVFRPEKKIDYAIIELKRNLKRKPLTISKRKPNKEDQIFSIGHPNGLPQKVATNGEILALEKSFWGKTKAFTHNLDLFHGNSGSPIFDQRTQKVIGIAVMGEDDYYQTKKDCRNIKKYEQRPAHAELAMSIDQVQF